MAKAPRKAQVTWMMKPKHIRDILQQVSDHWSDYWGIKPLTIPAPLSKSESKEGGPLRRIVMRRRTVQIMDSWGADPFQRVMDPVDSFDNDPERRLVGALIMRSLVDFSKLMYSPYHFEQKEALESLWWIMDLPFPSPWTETAEDEARFQGGDLSHFVLKEDQCFFRHSDILFDDLVDVDRRMVWYFPWDGQEELNTLYRSISFTACCGYLGLDYRELRRRAALIPPFWSGESGD